MSTRKPKIKLTSRERIAVLNGAIDSTRFAHGAVVGDPSYKHLSDPARCSCGYGVTIRGLASIRRECYVAIEKTRKAKETQP